MDEQLFQRIRVLLITLNIWNSSSKRHVGM